MLRTASGQIYTSGVLSYFDHDPEHTARNAKVFVPISFINIEKEIPTLALLDTGADWSVIKWELAEQLECEDLPNCGEVGYETRLGVFQGSLFRIPYRILAESGESLSGEGTFWASPNWGGPTILGYNGFLANLRTGLDPIRSQFHFGSE